MEAGIFETHYEEYCRRITQLDFPSIKDILGIESKGTKAVIPFFGEDYLVSGEGIADESGNRPIARTFSGRINALAEDYLDPESLIMIGGSFTQRLKKFSI